MSTALVDTGIFLYAVGGEHPYRHHCRRIIELIKSGEVVVHASVGLVEEFVHVRQRRTGDRMDATETGGWVAELCRLEEFNEQDLVLAMDIYRSQASIDFRDAVFAATALNRSIDAIISTDRDFDGIPRLVRIDPADETAIAALAR